MVLICISKCMHMVTLLAPVVFSLQTLLVVYCPFVSQSVCPLSVYHVSASLISSCLWCTLLLYTFPSFFVRLLEPVSVFVCFCLIGVLVYELICCV